MISSGQKGEYNQHHETKKHDFFHFSSEFFRKLFLFFWGKISILSLIFSIVKTSLISFPSHFSGKSLHKSGWIILSFDRTIWEYTVGLVDFFELILKSWIRIWVIFFGKCIVWSLDVWFRTVFGDIQYGVIIFGGVKFGYFVVESIFIFVLQWPS